MSAPVQSAHEDEEWDFPPEQSLRAKAHEFMADNIGLLLVGAAQIFFSTMGVAVQKLHGIDPPVTTLQLVLVRSGLTYICCMIYMLSKGIKDPWFGPKGVRLLLLVRGVGGFCGLFGFYFSLKYLSLSDATIITFLVPICTGISAALFLREPYTLKEGLAGVVSLVGVVLIARPAPLFGDQREETSPQGTQGQRLLAVGAGLVGILGATCAYTCIRAIGPRAHAMHAMVAFSLLATIACTVGMAIQGERFIIPSRPEWLALFLMIGIFGFLAQILLTMGLQRGKAGRSTLAVYTQIVFAVVLEKLFFGTVPPLLSVIGIVIIISSALFIAFTRERAKRDSKDIPYVRLAQDEDEEQGAAA